MLFLDTTLPGPKTICAFNRIQRMHLKATRAREGIIYKHILSKEEADELTGTIYWRLLTEPF